MFGPDWVKMMALGRAFCLRGQEYFMGKVKLYEQTQGGSRGTQDVPWVLLFRFALHQHRPREREPGGRRIHLESAFA